MEIRSWLQSTIQKHKRFGRRLVWVALKILKTLKNFKNIFTTIFKSPASHLLTKDYSIIPLLGKPPVI